MSDKKYITLDKNNFEHQVLKNDRPVLVDFWASWCGPCHMIAPVIEELAAEYDGKATIAKLDVDANQELAGRYGIRSIPSLLLFKNGEVVDQIVGVVSKSEISRKLNELLKEKTASVEA